MVLLLFKSFVCLFFPLKIEIAKMYMDFEIHVEILTMNKKQIHGKQIKEKLLCCQI